MKSQAACGWFGPLTLAVSHRPSTIEREPSNVSKAKRNTIIAAVCLLTLLCIWMYWPSKDGNSDEVINRDFHRCLRSLSQLDFAERMLPEFATRLFRVYDTKAKYYARFQADRKTLVSSGYFVEVRLVNTNRTMPQTLSRIRTVFHAAHAYWFAETITNSIVVICRPEHRSLCEKAVEND